MTLPIHSASVEELSLLTSHGRSSRLALAFLTPGVVWRGLINQTDFNLKYMSYLDWDTQTGNYANIVPGMALWIGSASGLKDKGIVRIRKAATSSRLFFDPVSHIRFENNLHLTVVDDFPLKSVQISYDEDSVPYAYVDQVYTNQNSSYKPVVIMGGETAVKLVDGIGSLLRDASPSWTPSGTITAYLWECSSASSITNPTSAQATFHFDTAGIHLISCQITSSQGPTNKRYQKVYVWDEANPPLRDLSLDVAPFGFLSSGGFECTVTLYENPPVKPEDGQQVLLFAHREYFGETETSVGQCPGSEIVKINGYIHGPSIQTDKAEGTVTFTIKTAQGLMQEANCQSLQIFRKQSVASRWDELLNPTLKTLFWHFITVRTTLAQVLDCYPPDSSRIYPSLDAYRGSIWDQLQYLAERDLSRVGVDFYGRLFCERSPESYSDSEKENILSLRTLERTQRTEVRYEELQTGLVSAVYSSSIQIIDPAAEPRTLYSVSPGNTELDKGLPRTMDYLALTQSESNSLAGRMLADFNNREVFTILIPENFTLLTLFPAQSIQIDIEAEETPLNEARSGLLVPEYVRFLYDQPSGAFSMEISGRFLPPEFLSANGVIPVSDTEGGVEEIELPEFPEGFEGLPGLPGLPSLPPLPELPGFPTDDETVAPHALVISDDQTEAVYYCRDITVLDPDWYKAVDDFPEETAFPIRKIKITPDGHIYIGNTKAIYWATLEEPSFKLLIDEEFLQAAYPGGLVESDKGISALGVNSEAENEIAIIMGAGYLGGQAGHIWIGNSEGLSVGTSVNVDSGMYPYLNLLGDIHRGKKGWVATYPSGLEGRAATIRFNSAGSSVLESVRHGAGATGGAVTTRYGGGRMIGWRQSVTNYIKLSEDEGMSWSDVPFGHTTTLGTAPNHCDISPSGTHIMCIASVSGGIGLAIMRSADSGVSFEEVILPIGFRPEVLCSVSDDIWFIVGHETGSGLPLIYRTDDFGDSWFPVYGNLPIIRPEPGDDYTGVVFK